MSDFEILLIRRKFHMMSEVPRMAIIMTMISVEVTFGDVCEIKFMIPLYPRKSPDERTISPSNIAANPWTFPSPYENERVRACPESFRAVAFTPETNISMRESSADQRIARLPERNPIIALMIVSISDTMRANLIPEEGDVGRGSICMIFGVNNYISPRTVPQVNSSENLLSFLFLID